MFLMISLPDSDKNLDRMSSEGGEKAPTAPEVDIYRDTPLRYAGYANEVGEAFRALVSVT